MEEAVQKVFWTASLCGYFFQNPVCMEFLKLAKGGTSLRDPLHCLT